MRSDSAIIMRPPIIFIAALIAVAWATAVHANCECEDTEGETPKVKLTRTELIACGHPMEFDPAPFEKLEQGRLSEAFRQALNLSQKTQVLPVGDSQLKPIVASRTWLIIDDTRKRAFTVVFQRNHPSILESIYELAFVNGHEITAALSANRQIQVRHAYIDGPVHLATPQLKVHRSVCLIESVLNGEMTIDGGSSEVAGFLKKVDLSGSLFLDYVRFRRIKFAMLTTFRGARFATRTTFQQTRFMDKADFSFATFVGKAAFLDTTFQVGSFASTNFIAEANFSNGTKFRGKATFTAATFGENSRFEDSLFFSTADFAQSRFAGETIFRRSKFRADAFFKNATFIGHVDYRKTVFDGEASFTAAQISGDNIDFTSARFRGDARFTLASFGRSRQQGDSTIEKVQDVSFKGTHFDRKADFAYVEFQNVDFGPFVPQPLEWLFSFELKQLGMLDRGKFPVVLRAEFIDRLPLSMKTDIIIVEKGQKWILIDQKFKQTFAIFKEGKRLNVYLKRQQTVINTFNLIGTTYQRLYINPQAIGNYAFDEPAFYKFIKNQKQYGQPSFDNQNVTLAFKRFQRDQKPFFLTRWFEKVFLDWTTQYGTSKVPWGLLIYAGLCICAFTVIYSFDRSFLMFVRSDGSVDDNRRPPNLLETFWFSLNTFVPAVEFFNASNWRPKYDVKFYGRFVRYSTLATFERILGWAMVPALLSYL